MILLTGLALGLALGLGAVVWRAHGLRFRTIPSAGFIESITSSRAGLSHARSSLSPGQRTATDSALTVPPPVIPQPLPPQAVWPPLADRVDGPDFIDVPADHWIYPVLADLANHQLISGFPDGSFQPDAPMTRAELAAQLVRLYQWPDRATAQPYSDVSQRHWAHNDIEKAVQMGFLSGYPDQTFRPDLAVSRIQVIVALATGLNLKSNQNPEVRLKPYQDHQQVPRWAQLPLVAALEANLLTSAPQTSQLAPHRLASRAEVVAMLHRALIHTGSLSPASVQPLPEAR
ncbi:MAG TPA: S-layer homology domain-containing protein [Leptolyngbyaceae cyanobacterium M65_K2018_010]|nr:S-layer homology domain-containing protein [Leptolyngbyaceae cyanobacterium M65_K2018_010]